MKKIRRTISMLIVFALCLPFLALLGGCDSFVPSQSQVHTLLLTADDSVSSIISLANGKSEGTVKTTATSLLADFGSSSTYHSVMANALSISSSLSTIYEAGKLYLVDETSAVQNGTDGSQVTTATCSYIKLLNVGNSLRIYYSIQTNAHTVRTATETLSSIDKTETIDNFALDLYIPFSIATEEGETELTPTSITMFTLYTNNTNTTKRADNSTDYDEASCTSLKFIDKTITNHTFTTPKATSAESLKMLYQKSDAKFEKYFGSARIKASKTVVSLATTAGSIDTSIQINSTWANLPATDKTSLQTVFNELVPYFIGETKMYGTTAEKDNAVVLS